VLLLFDERKAASLRRTLNVWEAAGVSVALMAPSMAININPQGTAAAGTYLLRCRNIHRRGHFHQPSGQDP